MAPFEIPDQLKNVYIHKVNKDYIIAITSSGSASGIVYQCLISSNGFEGSPISDGIFSKEALPQPTRNIYEAAVNLSKYLKKNGYKECNTIIQTKKGVQLR